MPWAVWLIEADPRRRRRMASLMVVGGALAAFMFIQAIQPEIGVRVVDSNLDYQLGVGVSALFSPCPTSRPRASRPS